MVEDVQQLLASGSIEYRRLARSSQTCTPSSHCLGTEGQRLFYTLPEQGETLEAAITALEKYFIPQRNVVAERHAFRKRAQAPHESVLQYVAALRDLANTSEFGANLDEMLCDQLVEYLNNPRIRERLLLELDLTLQKAINLATQIESAGEQAKCIAGDRLQIGQTPCQQCILPYCLWQVQDL